MSFVDAALAAVLGSLNWILGLAVLAGGGYWVWRRHRAKVVGSVTVLGYDPEARTVEMRRLEREDGGVRWEFDKPDRSDLIIALEDRFALGASNTGETVYFANLSNGEVFLPDWRECVVSLDGERVITEDAHPNLPAVERVSGQRLAAIRDAIAPQQMAGNLQGALSQLVKYAPWVLGLIAIALVGILYWMIRYVPVSEPETRNVGLLLLWGVPQLWR